MKLLSTDAMVGAALARRLRWAAAAAAWAAVMAWKVHVRCAMPATPYEAVETFTVGPSSLITSSAGPLIGTRRVRFRGYALRRFRHKRFSELRFCDLVTRTPALGMQLTN